MQLTGKLIQILPLQTGTGKNGEWKKQDIVVETSAQYPKKICVAIWGDKISASQLQIGNTFNIDFDLESREFNGRWYTDVKAWKIEVAGSREEAPLPPPPPAAGNYGFPEPPPLPANNNDDLPF
jgi:hypothetical protein